MFLANLFHRRKTSPTNGQYHHGNTSFIELRDIVKVYHNASGGYTALNHVNIQIERGEFVGIIGRSGSGKSTLMNMVTGIDRPTTGEVLVGDTAVHTLSENGMARWRGKQLGIVFQFFQLLPTLSVIENVMLPMDFCNTYSLRDRKKRAETLLDMVDMGSQAQKLPSALSGGQQQRVAIARALANDPDILIADEPTGNLDSRTADNVFQLFETLSAEGKTVVMVTHDSSLARRVSRTIIIADGEVVNEWVARSLPSLNPQLMLAASKKAQKITFPPGAPIIRQGEDGKLFYIITSGTAEVALQRPAGSDVVVTHMHEGQCFGELSLFHGTRTAANVNATHDAPLEALALDPETFQGLLAESDAFRASIETLARAHTTANQKAAQEQ